VLHLSHEKFDDDAIILKNMCREVTLAHKDGGRGLTVTYPDMPYLGIWHRPKSDAPYVCIEPWSSLPSRQDIIEDLACKSDLISLPSGMLYENTWSVTVF
jgi:galactose mutarotase-like enzyme